MRGLVRAFLTAVSLAACASAAFAARVRGEVERWADTVKMTGNGRKDLIRYQRRYPTEPVEERALGIDLTKPQYFAAYGEWTKKAGIARQD